MSLRLLWAGAGLWLLVGANATAGEPTAPPSPAGADDPAGKIRFDLCQLDAAGLIGPPGGKRSLDYEFCIPAGDGFAAEVAAIDPGARFYPRSPGRSRCGADAVLVIGNTHRPDFAFVLHRLAALPYVARIEPTHWE